MKQNCLNCKHSIPEDLYETQYFCNKKKEYVFAEDQNNCNMWKQYEQIIINGVDVTLCMQYYDGYCDKQDIKIKGKKLCKGLDCHYKRKQYRKECIEKWYK